MMYSIYSYWVAILIVIAIAIAIAIHRLAGWLAGWLALIWMEYIPRYVRSMCGVCAEYSRVE